MRRVIIKVHLWLGLTVGLIWALQGLTGGMLVFYRELTRVSVPHTVAGPMASVDSLLANASIAAGGARIVRLAVADARRDVVLAYYAPPDKVQLRVVVMDASTAQAIAKAEDAPATPFSGSAPRWIFLLHSTLLNGAAGEIVVGSTGLLLLTAVACGLWIGWPGRGGWRAAFSFGRWSSLAHKLYGWHRALGLAVACLLLLIALTGAYMSFDQWVDPVIGHSAPSQASSHTKAPDASSVGWLSAERALDKALARFPQAQWVRIYLPSTDEPVYRVQLHQAGESRVWLGTTSVSIDAVDGHVVGSYDALQTRLLDRVLDAAYPLHNGEIAGWLGRVLILLAGTILPVMLITGLVSWSEKRKRRSRRPKASRPAA